MNKLTNINGFCLFSGSANRPLAEKMQQYLNRPDGQLVKRPLGNVTIDHFKDGEIWVKYDENIRGATIAIVQPTMAPADNLLELLIMIDTAKRASAKTVITIIPYFGYQRQERKTTSREALSAKLVANLITTAGADRVITMDLHSPAIQGFFDIPVDHIYASKNLVPYWIKKQIPNLAIQSTDLGAAKMARAWRNRLPQETGLILFDKTRDEHNKVRIVGMLSEPENFIFDGANTLAVDDIIDTAGTFLTDVDRLKEMRVNNTYGVFVHPTFAGSHYQEVYDRIEASPVSEITVSDSIILQGQPPKKIVQVSVADLLAEAAERAFLNQSISSLYQEKISR
ncbi:MAG: ribose-phosphate diphosphokinase [Patescibacteria group bacterium]